VFAYINVDVIYEPQTLTVSAHGAVTVSPLLEWRLESSTRCPEYSGGCFKYPLRRLQRQDNDNQLQFHVNMHVYNKAGHLLSLSTDHFSVPSRYPPAKPKVFDLDPEFLDVTNYDVDIHFQGSMLCASWTHSSDHEQVSIEIGVGLQNDSDDTVPFKTVNETMPYCVISDAIQTNKMYFLILRISSSGGATLSSSDGITVADEDKLRKDFIIRTGQECSSNIHDTLLWNGAEVWQPKPLLVGQRYILYVNDSNIEVESNGTLIERAGEHFIIIPFQSIIVLNFISNTTNDTHMYHEIKVNIYECPKESVFSNVDVIPIRWSFKEWSNSSLFVYMVGIEMVLNNTRKLVSPFLPVVHKMETTVDMSTIPKTYGAFVATVKICSFTTCLQQVDSKPFVFESEGYKLLIRDVLSESIKGPLSCFALSARWNVIHNNMSVLFHQYSITRYTNGSDKIIPWRTLINDSPAIQVTMLFFPFS